MSIHVHQVVMEHSKSTGTDLAVLLYIADKCNDDGTGAYPGIDSIAAYARVSERSAQRSLRALQAMGEVTIEFKAGPHQVNRYIVNAKNLTQNPSIRDTLAASRGGAKNVTTTKTSWCQKRHHRGDGNVTSSGDTSVTQTVSEPSTEPSIPPYSPPGEETDSIYSEDFEKFWSAYPRKTKKGYAWKSWQKIKSPRAPLSEIVASVELHKQSKDWLKDDGEYIPHPSTWLNGRCWEDDVVSVKAAAYLHEDTVRIANGMPPVHPRSKGGLKDD
jgi:hypothetical protein